MMKMFRTDLAVVISGGGRSPVTVEDFVGRAIHAEYWVNQNREERAKFFQAKKEERAKGKQNPETQSKGPNSNPSQGNKQQGQGQNKRKGNFNLGNQKGQPQKKNNAGQVNNSFPTCNKCGKKHRENVELRQTFTSHVAKRAIFPRIVIPTPRIERIRISKEFRISQEPQEINCMQFKPRLTDPRFLREDWKLRNPKLISMPILGEMQQLELPQW